MAKQQKIDFVYCCDASGSMGRWISQVKQDILKVVKDLQQKHPEFKLRLAFVAYRDHFNGNQRLETLNFTEDINSFQSFVQKLKCIRNDDDAEDVLGGMQQTTTLQWSPSSAKRILFHICDSPPHNKKYHTDSVHDLWPNGYDGKKHGGSPDPPDYHKVVLDALKKINVAELNNTVSCQIDHYCIAKLNNTVSKMIRVFQNYGKTIGLDVQQRELKNTSELLKAVEETIFDAITVATPVNLDDKDVWQPINNRKRKFEAYVGIDFGTDGTGFAFAINGRDEILWQQNHTKNAHIKDRTNILLECKKPYNVIAFGADATYKYAQSKDKDSLYFDRFKMALYDQHLIVNSNNEPFNPTDDDKYDDDDDDEKTQQKPIAYLTAANGKRLDCKIVFSRAMGAIRKIAMKILEESAEILRESEVQWILTVPAIWSEFAKELMKESAETAGIKKKGIVDHLLIATEPECASIIARKNIKALNKINTKYIMLDLGGGTADIACHKTIENGKLEQIYRPTGGKWGSSYIDQEYEKILNQIFSKKLMDKFKLKDPNKWIDMKEKFRKSKHRFDGTKHMNIELSNNFIKFIEKNHENDDIEDIVDEFKYKGKNELIEYDDNGVLIFDKSVGIDMFKSVIKPIINETAKILKKQQMNGCKDILLSGGLSENKYLRKEIKKYFPQYRVHEIPRPILAVVEGAATMGLKPNTISTWFAPESIGLQITRDYDAKIDDESMKRKYEDVIDCGFGTLIEKEQKIDANKCVIKWFKPWKTRQQTEIKIKVYSSDKKNEKHTRGRAKGEWKKKLPSNWGNKSFPIVYWDKGSEKRLYIAHPKWDENDREMKIIWKKRF